MSENEGSSSLNSFADSQFSSEDDSDLLTGCYENEPEYTEAELKQIISDSESSSNSEDLDSSRLENLHWCTCENCAITLTMVLEECKCCRECTSLLSDKLTGMKCITENNDFKLLCLNKTVLETACIRQRRYENKFVDVKTFNNKQLRFSAYRQYTAWIHYYETLGRGCRVVIPSCVVRVIRETYPEANGIYTGFKNFNDF